LVKIVILPAAIEVKVLAADEGAIDAPDILVRLDLLWYGHYYYGVHLGLTDRTGMARISARDIEKQFAENRRLFPMDYKVPLDECDEAARISIVGSKSFLKHRAEPFPEWVTAAVAEEWTRARNGAYRPAQQPIALVDTRPIQTTIAIKRA
jgi:hypothetical protein